MEIRHFLEQLDALYARGDRDGAEQFMLDGIAKTAEEGDDASRLTILNELIGFYRNTGKLKQALERCEEAKNLLPSFGEEASAGAATTLLNIATAYRAAGMALEAVELYEQTEAMYRKLLSSDDLRFAGLYNNMSLAYQALSDWSHAEACLHQALDILERRGDHKAEAAITHSNLAVLFLRQREYDQAERHLHRSLAAFDEAGGKNVHRPAALAGLAQLYYYKQDFDQSVDTYLAALKEIEANFGRNRDYVVTSRSAAAACRAAGKDGLAAELEEQALAAEKALGGE